MGCREGSSRGGSSGWQARRLARCHIHHHRGRRFGGRPGVHRAADGAPTVGGIEFDAPPPGRRRPPGGRARRTGRLLLRTATHRPFRRRVAAQGQGRSPHHQRRHPADRHRGAVGQGAGGARRDRRLQVVEEADHRVSRIRRRAGVLPRERLRQGVPHADRLARSHRHGELRAVPARHARQDRRLSRRAAHRRVQDGVEPDDRAHLHAGPSRDGRVAQSRSVRTAREGDCQRTAEDGGGGPHAHRPRAVPARGRRARRADRRRRLRRRARRQGVARQGRVALRRARRIPVGVAGLARPEQGAAHRRALRRRDHQLGGEQLRLAARRGGRLRHDHPLPAEGAVGRHDQGDRAAHRQPRRFGDRVRRHLAGGRADPRRQAGDRLDVGRRRVRRVLHRACRRTRSSPSRRR